MTNKITSFFQVTKSSKRGKLSSNVGDGVKISPSITQQRDLESTDSSVGIDADDIGTRTPVNDDRNILTTATTTKRLKFSSECDEVLQLLIHLIDSAHEASSNADNTTTTSRTSNGSWKRAMQNHFDSKSFQTLSKFIATERIKHTIYPPTQYVWSALNLCPLPNVKVVIVGQDPYHGPNQAHGLSFSVLPGCPIPPSLKNIYKELMDDPKVPNFDTLPKHGHLIRWVHQGVLLLNAVMTVREKEPNSHQNKGWEQVTDEIIRTVLMYHCTNKDVTLASTEQSSDTTGTTNTAMLKGRGCVFLLWGKPATTKAMNVIEAVMTKNHTTTARRHPTATNNNNKQKTHAIICTSHPSPLGARKTSTPFLGSHCFSRCNEELIAMGHDPIDWNV